MAVVSAAPPRRMVRAVIASSPTSTQTFVRRWPTSRITRQAGAAGRSAGAVSSSSAAAYTSGATNSARGSTP